MSNGVLIDPKTPMYEKVCDPLTAIEYALKIDDHYDLREFLKDWNEGVWWPEYVEWVKKNKMGRSKK